MKSTLLLLVLLLPLSLNADEPEPYRQEIVVKPLLKTQTDGAGAPLVYPTNGDAEVTGVLVETPPGAQTGWHTHPVPCFAYVLEGVVEVKLASGETRKFEAGSAFA